MHKLSENIENLPKTRMQHVALCTWGYLRALDPAGTNPNPSIVQNPERALRAPERAWEGSAGALGGSGGVLGEPGEESVGWVCRSSGRALGGFWGRQ